VENAELRRNGEILKKKITYKQKPQEQKRKEKVKKAMDVFWVVFIPVRTQK
jgi:hypothetical protein